jgi:flagellar biosynthetic protein FlhB
MLVVNPQHIAVALAYRAGEDRAPRVVARGADHHALRLRRAALRWNVVVVEHRALARALFGECRRGDEVGSAHYDQVAELYLRLDARRA